MPMDYSIVDIESDGLVEDATKIHCVSINQIRGDVSKEFTLINYADIAEFFLTEPCIVGHNIIRYDIPVIEKLLNITVTARLIDTLGLSWYLYPDRIKHGLEYWGDDLGVEKPKIADWTNLSVEEYIFRCEQDREINTRLFNLQVKYLIELYDGDSNLINRLMNYLSFKLSCAREQEEMKWRLDIERCTNNIQFLSQELQIKTDTVRSIMPPVTKYKDVARPKELYKKLKKATKNNPDPQPELTIAGEKWLALLKEMNLPEYHVGTIKVPVSTEPGNPGSHIQLKNWLFSLGWIPETYKYVKDKETGSNKKIPQLNTDDSICDSVRKLYEKVPDLVALEGLFVLRHRIGILEGFLRDVDKDGFLKAEISGFTNTLRFQHATIVNLPAIPKPYWREIRSCLIAPSDDYILCGSDVSGLEDSTKRHYMYYYDPEYVNEMMRPDFDSHIDIALLAKMVNESEALFFKTFDKEKGGDKTEYERIKGIRAKSKKANFASVYGAGPPKIALTANISLSEAKLLHTTYWKRNWSVKRIAANCTIKTIGNQAWLFNPVSQIWYSLRVLKDSFSTLNQGTGAYCFDSWVRNVRRKGIKMCGQFHDEIITPVLKPLKEETETKLKQAMIETNGELQLNVPLNISVDFGNSYAEVH